MKNKAKIEEQQVEIIRDMFGHESTQEILWSILAFCGVYQANDGHDEYKRGVNEGKRRVGLYIEDLLTVVDTDRILQWKKDMNAKEQLHERLLKEDFTRQGEEYE